MSGSLTLKINDLEMSWDEDSRRKERSCVKCGKSTRGRTWGVGGIKKPACVGCAMDIALSKAKTVYYG